MADKINYQPNQSINNLVYIKELRPYISPGGQTQRRAMFSCVCGASFETRISDIKSGRTKSCGCYNIKKAKLNNTTHGLTNHRLYKILNGMKQRCYNPKRNDYQWYGFRGISICMEWLNSPEKFIEWAPLVKSKPIDLNPLRKLIDQKRIIQTEPTKNHWIQLDSTSTRFIKESSNNMKLIKLGHYPGEIVQVGQQKYIIKGDGSWKKI